MLDGDQRVNSTRRLPLLGYTLAWIPPAVVAVLVLGAALKPVLGLIGLAGPVGLLWFKPAPLDLERFIYAFVVCSPLIIAAALFYMFRRRPGVIVRFLIVFFLSVYWHGSAVVLWFIALASFN
jgi:hypothetical protein